MIIIVDYGMGNFGSIRNMLKKIGYASESTADPEVIAKADKIILPGIGHFDKAIESIGNLQLFDVLHQRALQDRIPFLGICLGMQLMTLGSEEGTSPGLGWFKAHTRRFDPSRFDDPSLRVPQMGWNLARVEKPSRLFEDDGFDERRYYFVHSYAVSCEEPSDVLCVSHYGYPFVAAFERDNLVGVQFHPEKSHKFGMSLLKRFVERY